MGVGKSVRACRYICIVLEIMAMVPLMSFAWQVCALESNAFPRHAQHPRRGKDGNLFSALLHFTLPSITSSLKHPLARVSAQPKKKDKQKGIGFRLTLSDVSREELLDVLHIRRRRRVEDPVDAILEHAAAVLAVLSRHVAGVERDMQLVPAVLEAHGPFAAGAGNGVVVLDRERDDDLALFVLVCSSIVEGRGDVCPAMD